MLTAAKIVGVLLGETGEPDQDYDHDLMNGLVVALEKAGYPGGWHREFDKYQGVYMVVPGVDKFWLSYEGGMPVLIPENDPLKHSEDETTEIPVDETPEYLVDYVDQRYKTKFAIARADAEARKFMDQALAKKPRRGSTRRGV